MVTQIGIISDTHMPLRWERLHDSIPAIFAGVDLILHAGDVGDLWVLQELSQIAPVIAVHGNDETEAATAALPFHLTMMIEGQRLVLNHGARRDPDEERAIRTDDRWVSKLDYLADFARQFDGTILVTGHLHVPINVDHQGVRIINPGALASGGLHVRQRVQTVARLTLERGSPPRVTHHDLNDDGALFTPNDDYTGNLQGSFRLYSESIIVPELFPLLQRWVAEMGVSGVSAWHAMTEVLRPLLMPLWRGEGLPMTIPEFAQKVSGLPYVPALMVQALRAIPEFAAHLDA
ncbi:MAG: metallophosphoesterase family protein [Chloroflexi bacterium]|nr:metallophosphoesterase family protein [Chloroflexota bacterium]